MRYFASLFCILFFGFFGAVFAQDDTSEFYIRTQIVGTDLVPPSTPTLLSATPVSPTQIDLVWSVSTDNVGIGGYIVERSLGAGSTSTIATTTLTSYSDTGLSASTTYNYSVRAFDTSTNYSTSSNMLSTTTPDFPPPPVTPTSTPEAGGTVARVVPEEVIITPDITSATFDIFAKHPARYEIKWGRTADYELGFIASNVLRRDYSTILTGLEPGTTYEYEIIGYTRFGVGNVVEKGQFRTLDDIDLTAPSNVSRFQAVPNGGDVNLSWQLPDEDDIAYVRIVRSHIGYPNNPNEGAVVYQGLGTGAIDESILFQYSPAYYTAFVYDESGNISSGAIARAFASRSTGDPGLDGSGFGTELEPLATTTEKMPDAFDIIVKQANREFTFDSPQIPLSHDRPFSLYLPADKVTKNLKSIIVELQDPTDQRQSFSFLLRLNKDRTAYEAVIAPLKVVGKSSIVLSIYDFRSLRVAEYRSTLSFVEVDDWLTDEERQAGERVLLWWFLFPILLLLLILILWILFKRRDEDKEEEEGSEKGTV